MQAVNTEYSKPESALPVRPDAKPRAPAKEGSPFRSIVNKALSEKKEKASAEPSAGGQTAAAGGCSSDLQLGALVAMLAEASVTVLPFGIADAPGDSKDGQTEQPVQAVPAEIAESSPKAAKHEGNSRVAQSAGAPAIEAGSAKPETANQAPAAAQGLQQKTDEVGKRSAPLAEKQTQGEKPAPAKSESRQARAAEVKQEAAKDVKQEAAKGIKQEAAKEFKQEFAASAKQETQIDAEKTYIKVGDGNKLGSEKFASQVSDKILAKMSEGKQQFEIELLPKELGKIIIKLVMQGGRAEIVMQCLNPKTQQLVMMNSESIRAIVEERTGMQTAVTVKEDAEAKSDMDGKGQGKQGGQEERQDRKWDEAETETFIQQLRLGLMEELKT